MKQSSLIRITAVCGIGALAASVLSGCSMLDLVFGGGAPSAKQIAEHAYEPDGPAGAWLLDGYAAGVGESWSAENLADIVCGVDDGVAVVSTLDADATFSNFVRGYDLVSGEEIWEVPNASCDAESVLENTAIIATTEATSGQNNSTVHAIDIATGDASIVQELPGSVVDSVVPLAMQDDTYYLAIDLDQRYQVVAWQQGSVLWSSDVAFDSTCAWHGEFIGCEHAADGTYSVIETAHGAFTADGVRLSTELDEIYWATDGYGLWSSAWDESVTPEYYSYSGEQYNLDDRPSESAFPRDEQGVYYPIGDLIGPAVEAVSASGDAVAFLNSDAEIVLLPSETVVADSGIGSDIFGVSADGATVLFQNASGALALIDGNGTTIESVPGSGTDYLVMGGYLVLQNHLEPAQILLPAS